MRVGLLITSIGNFGQKGFYNAQEIGLAKELDKLFDEVIVYKAVPLTQPESKILIEGCNNSILYQVPVKSNGINGIWDCNVMDASLDALVYFSDTQLAVPNVYKWCCKNNIKMYPYIGVIESHSTNKFKKLIINLLFKRNITVYKKCTCFVKNPTVGERLNKLGIKNTTLTPVGLDLSLLRSDYESVSINGLKSKYGYSESDKVILFIGRLIEEKQPIRMIEIFSSVRKKDSNYKLLMVGTGELKSGVDNKIKELKLEEYAQMIDRIPNSDIWELYRFADCFVNLNKQEIFGMAILEAMYYGCKVVAWKAPGPNLIIEDGVSGFLVEENNSIVKNIIEKVLSSNLIHERIERNFSWAKSANKIHEIVYLNAKGY